MLVRPLWHDTSQNRIGNRREPRYRQRHCSNLAKKGIDVLLTYHTNQAGAAATVAAVQALGRKAAELQLNTADVSHFDHFFKQVATTLHDTFGTDRLDFLINNAGTSLQATVTETTEVQFDEMMTMRSGLTVSV